MSRLLDRWKEAARYTEGAGELPVMAGATAFHIDGFVKLWA